MILLRLSGRMFARVQTNHKSLVSSRIHCTKWRLASSSTITKLDPAIQGYVHKLAEHQPCFGLSASRVRVLRQPSQFYQCLLDMLRRAKKRVFLSSLYIGSEELELVNTLHASLLGNSSLQLFMHLDLNRSTRPGPASTAQLLLPLLRDFPDRVHVRLFRSPKLKGFMAKVVPPRFNEGWGTWHPKIYGVDDEVMISGANLNGSYFTNRQDRYLYFDSQPQLADYCLSFLQSAAKFSYKLLPSPSSPEQYTLCWPDTTLHPHHIAKKAERVLSDFQRDYRLSSAQAHGTRELDSSGQDDTLIFPLIQAGQFNIREEERSLASLFQDLSAQDPRESTPGSQQNQPLMDLTSGYFSLYKPYRNHILHSSINCRIIAASPKANGFYGSRGISGRIPEGYTLGEQKFMRAVRSARREWTEIENKAGKSNSGIQMNEWEKEGWTYHAKGIWLRPDADSNPYLTLFGSTNLSSRSANLDTELSFLLATSSPALQQQLGEEVDGLREHARPWRGQERPVRFGTKCLVAVVGSML